MNARPYLVYKNIVPSKTLRRPRWSRGSLKDTFRPSENPDPVKGTPDDGINRLKDNDTS